MQYPVEDLCKEVVLPTSSIIINNRSRQNPWSGKALFFWRAKLHNICQWTSCRIFCANKYYIWFRKALFGFCWCAWLQNIYQLGNAFNRSLNAVTEYMQNISFMPPDCLKDSVGFKKANFISKPYQAWSETQARCCFLPHPTLPHTAWSVRARCDDLQVFPNTAIIQNHSQTPSLSEIIGDPRCRWLCASCTSFLNPAMKLF